MYVSRKTIFIIGILLSVIPMVSEMLVHFPQKAV